MLTGTNLVIAVLVIAAMIVLGVKLLFKRGNIEIPTGGDILAFYAATLSTDVKLMVRDYLPSPSQPPVAEQHLSGVTGFSTPDVRKALSELKSRHLIEERRFSDDPSLYGLTFEGENFRSYLLAHPSTV